MSSLNVKIIGMSLIQINPRHFPKQFREHKVKAMKLYLRFLRNKASLEEFKTFLTVDKNNSLV